MLQNWAGDAKLIKNVKATDKDLVKTINIDKFTTESDIQNTFQKIFRPDESF